VEKCRHQRGRSTIERAHDYTTLLVGSWITSIRVAGCHGNRTWVRQVSFGSSRPAAVSVHVHSRAWASAAAPAFSPLTTSTPVLGLILLKHFSDTGTCVASCFSRARSSPKPLARRTSVATWSAGASSRRSRLPLDRCTGPEAGSRDSLRTQAAHWFRPKGVHEPSTRPRHSARRIRADLPPAPAPAGSSGSAHPARCRHLTTRPHAAARIVRSPGSNQR
jgi:hypothetical protein